MVKARFPYKIFWGEIHTHTSFSDGKRTPEEQVAIARTHLDFWAVADHAVVITAAQDAAGTKPELTMKRVRQYWPRTQRVMAKHNEPGKFVTFLAYEVSTTKEGDFNIYYLEDYRPIYAGNSMAEICEQIKNEKAIVIPHHSAYKVGRRGIPWQVVQNELTPLVEIYSMHGSSESDEDLFPMTWQSMGPRETGGTVRRALDAGLKMGFIASSDDHKGYPGGYTLGLAAALAKDLTREDLWDAFTRRRTYAVTGDRIYLDFGINGSVMGQEIRAGSKRQIRAHIIGCDVLDRLDLIKNGRIINRFTNIQEPKREEKDGNYQVKFRLEWGWGGSSNPEKRRKNPVIMPWTGRFSIKKGELFSASSCFGDPPPNEIQSITDRECVWISTTDREPRRYNRECTNSIIFEVKGKKSTLIKLELNSASLSFTLAQILEDSHVIFLGDMFDERIKVHQGVTSNQFSKDIKFEDSVAEKAVDYYYIRVIQANGQTAWSSPIWINS